MSAREFKPGDVAMVDSWRGKGQIAFRTRRSLIEAWCVLDGHDTRGLDDHEIDEARPVVVIDPEDREQVERLWDSIMGRTGIDDLSDALREFADPRARRLGVRSATSAGGATRRSRSSVCCPRA